MIALGKGSFTVTGRGTLLKRTNKPIAEALLSLGVDIQGKDEEYRLPIKIKADGSLPGERLKSAAQSVLKPYPRYCFPGAG